MMKLVRIQIVNFGQFSNFTFDLSNSNIDVFYGVNEAGKSTVVAFIKQILFGFHLANQGSEFFENYTPLAQVSPMGGSLFFENENGQHYQLERLYAKGKGSKAGTLTVKCDNQVIPESVFFDQIKNIDGKFYTDSFIFNQDMLAKVDQIKQKDLMERIYYLGAANSDSLITLRDDFAKSADALFKKTGRKPPINQLLLEIKEQENEVSNSENEFSVYQELNDNFKKQKGLQHQEEQKELELEKEYDSLDKIQKLFPSYEKLQDLQNQVRTINFDSKQFQSAQTLTMQAESLHKKQQKITAKLNEYSNDPEENTAVSKLLQKKPEVLQWQSEYRNCLQKDGQIKDEQNQLIALDSNLNKIVKMNQEQIIKLQEDYQKLPQKELKIEQSMSDNSIQFFLFGGIIFVVGLILLFIARVFGFLASGAGLALIVFGSYRQKQTQKAVETAAEQNEKIRQQRQSFERRYGFNPINLDINNLINEWRQYQVLIQNLKRNNQRKNELIGLVTPLAVQLGDELNQTVSTFEDVLNALDQLTEKINLEKLRREKQTGLKNSLVENKDELNEITTKLKMILAKAQVSSLAEYEQVQKQKLKQDKIQNQIDALKSNLQNDLSELKSYAKNKTQNQNDLKNLRLKISSVHENINHLQEKTAEIKVKMENLANSTAVFEEKQKLANLKAKLKNLSIEYLANLFTAKWIGRALDLASNERFPKMLVTVKEYLRLLTNNRYNNIEFGKKITVTRFDGKKIEVQYLSRGTSEQLYFALKLAFVQQIQDEINLPILIDDSFVNFDDQRVNEIEKLLQAIARNNQVLIFTAQTSLVDKLRIQPLTFKRGTKNV
ncbi:DNA repair protein [Lactobacillus kullabergensis]|nr:DNA repair protein [Lactobacillus kullabergensis]